ncbi:MAG: hypothetical protein R2755_11635 [Acidimicrobiales bacterium]
MHADTYLGPARRHATVPVKQAVIAASALSLLYPADGIDGYSSDQFIDDLARGRRRPTAQSDAGAHCVQIDHRRTSEGEARPSLQLLDRFVALNNRALGHFSAADRARIGVHTCPGGDQDATHSADVDYAELLPKLFDIDAGAFYLQMASETDPDRVLAVVGGLLRPHQRVFVGVTDPIDPTVETVEVVRDCALQAARHIPVGQLGTTDDCGFAPFADDVSTSRDIGFAKIAARIAGTCRRGRPRHLNATAAPGRGLGAPEYRTGQYGTVRYGHGATRWSGATEGVEADPMKPPATARASDRPVSAS